MTWLGVLVILLIGVALGAYVHAAWLEEHHDCMPHSSDRCPKGEGR